MVKFPRRLFHSKLQVAGSSQKGVLLLSKTSAASVTRFAKNRKVRERGKKREIPGSCPAGEVNGETDAIFILLQSLLQREKTGHR